MAQRRYVIGTEPVVVANANPRRSFVSVIFLPTDIEAGNTGRVHVGKGFPPTATVGDPTQGDILQQGGEFRDEEKYEGDTSVFRGMLFARASAANQIVVVDEGDIIKPATPATPPTL